MIEHTIFKWFYREVLFIENQGIKIGAHPIKKIFSVRKLSKYVIQMYEICVVFLDYCGIVKFKKRISFEISIFQLLSVQ